MSQVNAIATVLLAAVLLGERITRQKVLGMVLAVAGVLLVLFTEPRCVTCWRRNYFGRECH